MAKSYNFETGNQGSSVKKPIEDGDRLSNGFIVALACGPLRKQRYINPKIEKELVDFKREIEGKFAKSAITSFQMPRLRNEPQIRDSSSDYNEISS